MELNQLYRIIDGRPRHWVIMNGQHMNKPTETKIVPTKYYCNKLIGVAITQKMISFYISSEINKENYNPNFVDITFRELMSIIDGNTKIKCDSKFVLNPDLHISKIYYMNDEEYLDIY